MKNNIKVISFDIGNTIYKLDNNNRICNKIANIVNKDIKIVRPVYEVVFYYSNTSLEEKVISFCDKLDVLQYKDEIFNCISNIIINPKLSYVDNNIVGLLEKLKKEKFTLIAISKSSNIHHDFKNQELLKYFDYIFRTADYNLSKRDEKFYTLISEKLHVNNDQIIHIGNNYIDDFSFPKKYKLHTILYNAPTYPKNCATLENVYQKIHEICQKLDKN